MSAICQLAKIEGFLNLTDWQRVLKDSFLEPKLVFFLLERNWEQQPWYFLLKNICRYFLLLSLMSLFVFNSCVRVGCVLMSVMSVTKRGNQHFYTLHRAGAGAMIKFKLESLTLCDPVRCDLLCAGRGEITTDTGRASLCSRENFSAKELFQTSWRKVFLAACAANWNWNHAR